MKVKFVRDSVDLPRQKEGDAGMDLRAAEEINVPAGDQRIIRTGMRIAIPQGCVGLIWDRSGLAAKYQMHCLAGVIDPSYRGEIGVVIRNFSSEDFLVEKDMRIAQLLIQNYVQVELEEVDSLDSSDRNEDGFGSSGLR